MEGESTMKKALLIIDVQNDYFKGGKCELFKPEEAAAETKKVLDQFRANGDKVIYIQHENEGEGVQAMKPHTKGVEIYEGIKPQSGEEVIVKHYPSSFLETTLQDYLKKNQIEELVVCGMMSHMCVDTTVRAAAGLGYKVTVLEDACATKHIDWKGKVLGAEAVHEIFMASLAGAFANVITTAEYLNN